jgi:hypothetical protein
MISAEKSDGFANSGLRFDDFSVMMDASFWKALTQVSNQVNLGLEHQGILLTLVGVLSHLAFFRDFIG